jgi:hypothetical protein
MNPRQSQNNSKRDLLRYAGLGTQIFAGLGISVFIGLKIDKWLNFSTPLLVWILPLLFLAAVFYKLIKETSKQAKDDETK